MENIEINNEITSQEFLVIGSDGSKLGVMCKDAALKKAFSEGLDLVCMTKTPSPVCKIMDYNKYKFNLTKKEKASKKNQHTTETSEVRISLTIQQHDIDVKIATVKRLIDRGDNVLVDLRLCGRELNHMDAAKKKIYLFVEMCSDFAKIKKDLPSVIEGRDLRIVLEKK